MTKSVFHKIKKTLGKFFTRRIFGFCGGGAISYSACLIFAGKATYQQGILPSIIFNVSNWQVHLHHWLLSFIVMTFFLVPMFAKKKINESLFLFVFGFSLGLIFQGILSYSDWFEIITKIG
jgi:hypothetical protein